MSKPEALQVAGTLMERLQACAGMPVTVYLSCVNATLMSEMPEVPSPGAPCPGFGPGFGPGTPFGPGRPYEIGELRMPCPGPRPPCPEPRPPCPGPEPMPPMMMTTVVQGILAFAGEDYLSLSVMFGQAPGGFFEVAIPYNAVGMVICGGTPV